MKPFLEKLASHLYSEYGDQISRLCVVFPNRRAGLFLKQYISRLISKPIWLPDIYALEDFVVLKSGLVVPDQITLLVKLYRLYQTLEEEKAKSFAEFTSWGAMLLSDFDEIDQYLADGAAVFSYLDELKAMKHWNPDGTPLTPFEKEYLQFYNSLAPIYTAFQALLLESGQGYFGLAFKQLIAKMGEESFGEWDKVVLAGFNALTVAEERLFTHLLAGGKGEVFWDADEYYLTDARQEAGRFMRSYLHDRRFGAMNWIGQTLRTDEKHISIIGVPGNVGQAKLAGQLAAEIVKNTDPSDIAIVLVDEGLLLPVLNSIPREIDHFNVTMGYPLKLTPVYTLFDVVFNLLSHSTRFSRKTIDPERKESIHLRFHHKDLDRLLSHPYLATIQVKSKEVRGRNGRMPEKSFYNSGEVLSLLKRYHPGLSDLFSAILQAELINAQSVVILLQGLVNLFRIHFAEREEEGDTSKNIDIEYLYHFSLLLDRLELISRETGLLQDIETLYEIFCAQVSGMRLPFYGEPLKGLQLMGMLETRALDFKNIIMLSVNEGQLPKGKHQNTFVPDEVRREYGLQRYNERNAVFGYHFYRLLHRVEKIYLLYNTEGTELGGGEKSRFLSQIKYELPSYNSRIRIEERILSVPPAGHMDMPVIIAKDEPIIKRLHEIAGKGFSPTALGRYLACSLQFCYSQVMSIREPDQVEETIDAATLGEAVHEVLCNAYSHYTGMKVTGKDIESMLPKAISNVKQVFSKEYPASELEAGKNLLILKVAENMVKRFFLAESAYLDKLPAGQQFVEILRLESGLEAILQVPDARTGELFPVKLAGNADRIDRIAGTTRVIDYKTGQVKNPEVRIDNIQLLREHDSPAKLLQLLAYAWMYRRMNPSGAASGNDLVSGIISLRFASKYLINATIGKQEKLDESHLSEFEELLIDLLSEIFNPEIPFKQTDNTDVCNICAYQKLCNRVIN